jgi:hypothetical protein
MPVWGLALEPQQKPCSHFLLLPTYAQSAQIKLRFVRPLRGYKGLNLKVAVPQAQIATHDLYQ